MPSGVFKPYAGASTAILVFTKTNSGGTDSVWFYNMEADGFSLDDHRQPLLEPDKMGINPTTKLTKKEHQKNNLPDIISRWSHRNSSELNRKKTEQSFSISKKEIEKNNYILDINSYKKNIVKKLTVTDPKKILDEIKKLSKESDREISELEKLLK